MEGPQSPYKLDYIAGYFRNHAIFAAVIALGLDLLADEFAGGRTISGIDYETLPGVPHDILLLVAGVAFLALGIALSLWNTFASVKGVKEFHAASPAKVARPHFAVRCLVLSALGLGALIPYGFAMLGLRVLTNALPA